MLFKGLPKMPEIWGIIWRMLAIHRNRNDFTAILQRIFKWLIAAKNGMV